jgi:hypothetical protein
VTLDQFLNSNFPELTHNATEASLQYDDVTGEFEVVQGKNDGKVVDDTNVLAAIDAQMSHIGQSVTLLSSRNVMGEITAEKAESAKAEAEKLLTTQLNFKDGDELIYVADQATRASFIKSKPNFEKQCLDVLIDDYAIGEFVQNTLKNEISTPTVTKKILIDRATKAELEVTTEGVDGKSPKDISKLAERISQAMKDSVSLTAQVEFEVTPYDIATSEVDDSRWIEYNMNNYCVYFHSGDTVITLTCNTAKGKASTPTITGTFRVYKQVYEQCMPNPPSPEPLCNIHYVTYWGEGGYAFHEAWWLTTEKEYNGISHGCINMYINDAQKVYEFAELGTKVWVHY